MKTMFLCLGVSTLLAATTANAMHNNPALKTMLRHLDEAMDEGQRETINLWKTKGIDGLEGQSPERQRFLIAQTFAMDARNKFNEYFAEESSGYASLYPALPPINPNPNNDQGLINLILHNINKQLDALDAGTELQEDLPDDPELLDVMVNLISKTLYKPLGVANTKKRQASCCQRFIRWCVGS